MFTDIKGFTARTSESTREGMVQLLAEHERLLTPVFRRFRGTVIKTIGDAFLVSFESPTDAVLCGMVIQEVLRQYNATAPERDRLDVRVAVNVGDVEIVKGEHGNDVFGEAVNLAARLEGIAEAGEVTFTEAVFLTMNRSEVPTAEIGEHTFKGIPKSVKIFRVVYDPNSDQARAIAESVRMTSQGPKFEGDGPSTSMSRRPKPRTSPYLYAGVALAIAVIATVAFAMLPGNRDGAAEAKVEALLSAGQLDEAVLTAEGRFAGGKPGTAKLRLLSTRARLRRQLKADDRDIAAVQKEAREQMERWPEDGAVPFELVKALRGEYAMVNWVWFATQAYARGYPPDPGVRDELLSTMATYDGAGQDMELARALLLQGHRDEALAWAGKAIEDTKSIAFLNALALLQLAKDPLGDDPHAMDVRDLLRGMRMEEAKKRLLAAPPEKRAHAKAVFLDGAERLSFMKSNRLDVIAAAEAL